MSNTITCPSGLQVRIRGLKVKEEKILTDRKLAKSGEQIEQIIRACTEELVDAGPYDFDTKIDWAKMLQGDRFFILLKIREETYGTNYEFKCHCSNGSCREAFDWEIDTSELPVKALPEGSTPTSKHTVTLPDCEATVTFHLANGGDEVRMRKLRKGNEDEPITVMLMARVDAISGVDDNAKARRAFFAELTMGDLAELRAAFDEVDCGVETGIEVECPECGQTMELDLPFERRFLLPERKKSSSSSTG